MGTDLVRRSRRGRGFRLALVVIAGAFLLSACVPATTPTSTSSDPITNGSETAPTVTGPVTTAAPTSPATTDTRPPSTSEPGGFIAHIGCSQTKLSIRGYQRLGGTRLEPYETGGGQISLWSRPGSEYWEKFDQAIDGRTVSAAWIEICMTNSGARTTSYEEVVSAVEVLREKIPAGSPIFVSGLEIFEPADLCTIAGPSAADLTRSYADRLVADGWAEPGPLLGPLDASTTTDGCHPNGPGAEMTGRQLLEFFG